jgi:hypothetical protein
VLYSLFLLLSRGQQIIHKKLYCDSKTHRRIVCQDWTKWWPVLSCLEQMGFLLVNAGGHVAGRHAQGLFPLLTSGWTLVQPTAVQTIIKGPAFSPICSQQRVSVRRREERKKKIGGKEKKGREEKRREKRKERKERKREKEKGRRGRGKKNRRTIR